MLREVRAAALTATLAFSLALAACGSGVPNQPPPAAPSAEQPVTAAPRASAPRAAPLVPIRYSFDFVPNGEDSPFYAALVQGYYRAQGLAVTIVKGINASDSTQWVAGGKVDLTYDAAGAAAQAITKGAPLKVLAVTIQRDPLGLVYRQSAPLRRPTDLYGKTVAVPPGTDAALLWTAFAAHEHLDLSRIKVANASPTAEAGLLGQGKVAAFSAYGYLFVPTVDKLGIPAGFMAYGDYGVPSMAETIVTTRQLLRDHPDWARKFLYESAQGFAFAQAHPNQAVADMRRSVPQLDPKVAAEQLVQSFAYLHSPNTQAKPWGWQAAADWTAEIGFLQRFEGLKDPLPVARYYTNAYLPTGPVAP